MRIFINREALLCLMACLFSANTNASIYNGDCGDSLQWSFNDEIGLLEIYGKYSGEAACMSNYSHYGSGNESPWYEFRNNIQSVEFSDVSSIGSYAFLDCSSLTSISIPEGVISIGYAAFSGCNGLTSITIPESVPNGKIGKYAFSGCTGELILKNQYIPAGEYVGSTTNDWDGVRCSPLLEGSKFSSIKVNGFIGNYALAHLSTIQSVEIGVKGAITSNKCFYDCSASKLIINGGIGGFTADQISRNIGGLYDSYLKGTKFTKITINCESISNYACHHLNLNTLELGNDVRNIGEGAFYDCEGGPSFIIPYGVTTIGDKAFSSCSGLSTITIPYSVTTIGNSAFESCTNLTSVTIPNSVTSIGTEAFYSCYKITEVNTSNPIPPSCAEDAFGANPYGGSGAFRNAVLYVPTGSLEEYKSAPGWRNFLNIQEKDFEDGITEVLSNNNSTGIYDISGKRQMAPYKGINIFRYSSGTTRKVLIK